MLLNFFVILFQLSEFISALLFAFLCFCYKLGIFRFTKFLNLGDLLYIACFVAQKCPHWGQVCPAPAVCFASM